MPGPSDLIPVKFTEELAQYAEVRPVRRQPMTLHELVGLVLASTGKHPARVQEILRRGACTYNVFRYWWNAVELEAAALDAILRQFPDADPARLFDGAACVWVCFTDDWQPRPHRVLISKAEAAARRFLRRQSLWSFLMGFVAARSPAYVDYSYYDKADIYSLRPSDFDRALLIQETQRLARGPLRGCLARADLFARLELACVRHA